MWWASFRSLSQDSDWSAVATFEGEFSNVTASYAAKGVGTKGFGFRPLFENVRWRTP